MFRIILLSFSLFILSSGAMASPQILDSSSNELVIKKRKKKNGRYKKKKRGLFKRIFKGKNGCDCPKH